MYSYSGAYDRTAMGMLAGMSAGMIVVSLAMLIFSIVCMWKIFEKAGEAGWKSLIPIYNVYVWFKIAWEGKYFLAPLLCGIVAGIFTGIGTGSNSAAMAGIGSFLTIIVYGATAVIGVIATVKLAKRFGKSAGFAVGLILLSLIFEAILAFDSSTYDRSLA